MNSKKQGLLAAVVAKMFFKLSSVAHMAAP